MYFRKLAKGDDCRTKLKEGEINRLARSIKSRLNKKGYDCKINLRGSNFELHGCRLNDQYVKKHGRNLSPYAERWGKTRRGRVLGWNNWVQVNNAVNAVMDEKNVCGKIDSLHGKFKVRDGKRKYTEDDWEDLGCENVGSEMYPMQRCEAWRSEREY